MPTTDEQNELLARRKQTPLGVDMGYWKAAALVTMCVAAGAQTMSIGYGEGCSARRASFYEHWAPGTCDMNTFNGTPMGYTMIQHDAGWFVLPLQSPWRHPAVDSDSVVFGPDGMSQPISLGFSFSYPGGQASSVWVHEDGFACFGQSPYYVNYMPPAMRFLNGAPCLAAFWTALDSCSCGAVRIERDPVASAWTAITWSNVRETGTPYLSTFQAVIHASGQIDVVLLSCHANSHPALSGWSPGYGALQPGTCDLSALNSNMVITFPDRDPMLLQTGDAPRLGATVVMETSGMPESVKFVFTAIGTQGFDPGIDLTPVGATGCSQHASYETGIMTMAYQGSSMLVLDVPQISALIGSTAYLQSVGFDRSANPAGVLLSNGFSLHVTP